MVEKYENLGLKTKMSSKILTDSKSALMQVFEINKSGKLTGLIFNADKISDLFEFIFECSDDERVCIY